MLLLLHPLCIAAQSLQRRCKIGFHTTRPTAFTVRYTAVQKIPPTDQGRGRAIQHYTLHDTASALTPNAFSDEFLHDRSYSNVPDSITCTPRDSCDCRFQSSAAGRRPGGCRGDTSDGTVAIGAEKVGGIAPAPMPAAVSVAVCSTALWRAAPLSVAEPLLLSISSNASICSASHSARNLPISFSEAFRAACAASTHSESDDV